MHGMEGNILVSYPDADFIFRTQYCEAQKFMNLVNRSRNSTPVRERKIHQKCVELLGNTCLSVLGIFDKVRMLIRHTTELRTFSAEQTDLRKDRLDARIDDTQEPWTMQTAFHGISGACVHRSRYTTGKTVTTLDLGTLDSIASEELEALLPIQLQLRSTQAKQVRL
jgi:hypothetical protein